jgi:hypothetical protein
VAISKNTSWFDEESGYLIRPYAITGGRTHPNGENFPLITQVATTGPGTANGRQGQVLQPELAAILDLCRERSLAIVEIAALLDLPPSVVKVLCGDLLTKSLIVIKTPGEETSTPSVELLERVIRGIREL